MKITRADYKGYTGLRLETDLASVFVLPAHGAHIASFFDGRLGYEWLYQTPEPIFCASEYGADFTAGECAGIDDMFPNAAETSFQNIRLPDHGEGWTLPHVVQSADENGLQVCARGVALPYRLEKRFFLEGASLRLDYRVENEADFPLPFLFAAHPLFPAAPGDFLELAEPQNAVKIVFARGLGLEEGRTYRYPKDKGSGKETVVFSSGFRQKDTCCKFVFAQPVEEGRCRLVDARRSRAMEMTYDAGVLPYLGIWTDHGACGRRKQINVSMEPSTHESIVLPQSIRPDTFFIPPRGQREWWIRYTAQIL